MISSPLKWYLIALFLIPLSLSGQDNKVDSLIFLLKTSKSDTQKVNIYNGLSYTLFQTNPDTAIFYGKEAKVLAKKINYQKGLAYANKNIGLGYYMLGDFTAVLSNWEQSLNAFENINDKEGEANINGNIGAVYFNFGDDAIALEYYLKSLKVAEEIEDDFRIYTMLVNIGTLYLNKKITHDKALDYFRQAIPYLDNIKDQQSQGNLFTNLGELYTEKEKYDSAIYYLDKALESFDGTAFYPQPLNLKGKVLLKKGEIERGIELQQQAVEIAKELGQKLLLTQSLLGLGESYLLTEDYIESIKILKSAIDVAEIVDSDYHLKDIYFFLSSAYAKLNNFQQAYFYSDLYSSMKDTLYSIEAADKIKGLQFTYQIEKQLAEIDLLEAANEIQQLETKTQKAISWGAGSSGILLLFLVIGIFRRYKFIQRIKKVLEREKDRSDNLLLNILPAETAEELKENGSTQPKHYDSATVLFTDFKGFTTISAKMTPTQLVTDLHECFKMFDIITSRYGLEKIKTIGDAYMAAGGLPKANDVHPYNVAQAALEIRNYMDNLKRSREKDNRVFFEVRIGIHTGPVVAGVVGIKKFAYDIWGDTVNIAARMESNSEAGRVNISESTYQIVKDKFDCEYRGEIEAKNAGKLRMYFLNDLKEGELEAMKLVPKKNEPQLI